MRSIKVGETHTRPYRVSFADMDRDYRLSMEAVLGYFQDAASDILVRRNIAAFDLHAQGCTWVISDFTVDMVNDMPMWRETVETVITPSEVSGVRVYFDFRIIAAGGRCVASGTCCWTAVNMETGRPTPIPSLMDVEGENQLRHDRLVFPAVTEPTGEYQHVADMSDIDFNEHVNNISYVKVAISALPADYVKSHALSHIAVKFMRQCYLSETLTCRYRTEGDTTYSSILNGSGQEAVRLVISMTDPVEYRPLTERVPRD